MTRRSPLRWFISQVEGTGNFVLNSAEAILACFLPPYRPWLILQQADFIGVGSIFIIVLTGIFTGAVFTLQSLYAFSMFNLESMVGATVTLALTRELSPVLAALMLTGRAGSAMATELGTMRVTEQIDALGAMAVNPVQYLFVPRLLAAVVMFPILTMVFNLVGVLGSYLVAINIWGVDPGNFLAKIRWYVSAHDITSGLIKSSVFGGFIALVSCYKGFNAQGGARGVGLATTQAVVVGSVSVLIIDYFLTVLMF
ncbi:MAG: ABC transporter permease [Deltaproteobacteria bacterium]|nr:MAG: ABC transporter permease [Deltaproteobacteria bacterium]